VENADLPAEEKTHIAERVVDQISDQRCDEQPGSEKMTPESEENVFCASPVQYWIPTDFPLRIHLVRDIQIVTIVEEAPPSE